MANNGNWNVNSDEDAASQKGSDENNIPNNLTLVPFQDKNDLLDVEASQENRLKKDFAITRNYGKKGKPINVTINYVPVFFTDPGAVVFHYDVRIDPLPERIEVARKVFKMNEAKMFPHSSCVFDGKRNLYSKKPILSGWKVARISESVNIFSEQNTFNTVKILNSSENRSLLPIRLLTQSSSYKEQMSISGEMSAFNVVSLWDEDMLVKRCFRVFIILKEILRCEEVLKENQSSSEALPKVVEAMKTVIGENALKKCEEKKMVQSGDIIFMKDGDPIGNLMGGINLHFGFRQTIVTMPSLFHYNFFLAIDITYGCFFDKLPVIDLISVIFNKPKSYLRECTLQPWQLEVVKYYLRGIKIVYQDPDYDIMNREHIVSDVAASAETIRLNMGPVRDLDNFNGFFSLGKIYDLEFPNMPFLLVGPPGLMVGLPCELCSIADGQIFKKRMTNAQKEAFKELLLELRTEPKLIKDEIIQMVTELELDRNKLFSEFDIRISKNLIQTVGRVLKPPKLVSRSAMFPGIKQVLPNEGSWDLEHFENAATIDEWAICNVDPNEEPDLKFLATALRFRGLRLGMKINEPKLFSSLVQSEEDMEKDFESFVRDRKKENCDVLLVVIPSSGMFYGKIKQIAELQVGILTQCLKSSTVTNLDISIMNNLLLKLNAKLNGNNYNIKSSLWPEYFVKPVLVVGAFVNVNDPKINPDIPYIASIVGNYNRHATKNNVIWSFIKSDLESIEDLDKIIAQLITYYWQESGVYPEKILYYRDGVLEENIWVVMEEETDLIRKGCVSLHPLYEPSITFIEVTRDHPAMFLPNKLAYIPPGTVVDSTIVNPNEVEFYLMSHSSFLGGPRPSKYHVLLDDSELSEDDIQEITYYLCHLSCRCTRSVPFPVQLYYARLATYRAQKYFDRNSLNKEEIEKIMKAISNVNNLLPNNPMFFV